MLVAVGNGLSHHIVVAMNGVVPFTSFGMFDGLLGDWFMTL